MRVDNLLKAALGSHPEARQEAFERVNRADMHITGHTALKSGASPFCAPSTFVNGRVHPSHPRWK